MKLLIPFWIIVIFDCLGFDLSGTKSDLKLHIVVRGIVEAGDICPMVDLNDQLIRLELDCWRELEAAWPSF